MTLPAIATPDWLDDAACSPATSDLFFPGGQGVRDEATIAEAKSICAGCPVRQPCLADDLEQPVPDMGIRAGMTENQRRKLKGLPPPRRVL